MFEYYLAFLNQPASFNNGEGEVVKGFVTAIFVHTVDGEPRVFMGYNPTSIEGVVTRYYQLSEVALDNPENAVFVERLNTL